MNCDEVQEYLADYLDGSLGPSRAADVKAHLDACSGCRAISESLAECVYRVQDLPEVDPPLGFTKRVMARVREVAAKPPLWERLIFPLRIKIPLHAAAVVVISLMAVYLLEREPRVRSSAVEKNAPAPEVLRDLDAAQEKAGARAKEGSFGSAPATPTESKPKSDQAISPRKDPGMAGAAQEQRQLESKFAAKPGVTARSGDETAIGGSLPSTGALRPGEGAKSDAPKLEERSVMPKSAASPPLPGVRGESQLADKRSDDLRQKQIADVELVVRRVPQETQERKETRDALARSKKSAPAPQDAERRGRLFPILPESAEPQEVWLTLPRARYDELKRELVTVGSIESESQVSSRENEAKFRGQDLLQIKITVLPPDAGSGLPGRPLDPQQ